MLTKERYEKKASKPTVKTSQIQSWKENLTGRCATKAGTYQAPLKVSHQGPRTSYQGDVMNDVEQATVNTPAKGKKTGKGQNMTNETMPLVKSQTDLPSPGKCQRCK